MSVMGFKKKKFKYGRWVGGVRCVHVSLKDFLNF